MNKECAVCYVSDMNFLLPSLVSALSLRKFISPTKADIFIFIIDEDKHITSQLTPVLETYSINTMSMNSAFFTSIDDGDWNKTHVPKAALGRFFISDLLPEGYKRLLYLDGDTFIVGDLASLIDFSIPEGKVAAVDDIISFCRNDSEGLGKKLRKYFKDINVKEDKGYFNSGVLLASANTWKQISKETFEYLKKNLKKCLYHDQSALNAIIGDRRIKLSLAWNFQTPYRYLGIEKNISPRIYHFTQSAKPWKGKAEPWTDIYPVYQEMMKPLANLNLPNKIFSQKEILYEKKISFLRKTKLRVLPFRLWKRHKSIKIYMEQSYLL